MPQLDAAARRTLLDQLAAKRRQKQGTASRSAYADLEDSDSSAASSAAADSSAEDESFATAASRQPVVLDDSSDDENEAGNNRGATSRPASGGIAAGRLRRLQKAGEPAAARQPQHLGNAAPSSSAAVITIEDSSDEDAEADGNAADDIAAQLGSLSIRGKNKSGGAGTKPGPRRQQPVPAPGTNAQASAGSSTVGNSLVLGSNGEFKLNAKTSCMLYPHQVEGVRWLWSLYRLGRGGILADDMGLGKTIQCAAFLAGLIESKLIRRAIVVAPKTLLAQWRKELGVCGLGRSSHEYGGTVNERAHALDRVVSRRGVLLVTYGMVLHNAEVLGQHEAHDPDEGPMWDVMICDEGHKLKNPRMQLRKQLDAVPTALRIIISGTPIQNNLLEMWALFNFCAPDVLGDAAHFRDQYERVITNGSDKHATQYERERGAVAAARLRQEVGPYMLRREKKEVFKPAAADSGQDSSAAAAGGTTAEAAASSSTGGAKPASMPHKNDLIVWLKLKPMQRRVYQAFLNSDSVKRVFNQTASALAAITVLKKVCDHPALLSDRAAHGIVSGASRARRQAAARLGGGLSGSGSDVEEIEDSSGDEVEVLESEEREWESGSEDYSSDNGQAERRRQQARRKKQQQQRKAKQGRRDGKAAAGAAVGGESQEDWDLWASAELEQKLLDEVHTTGFASSCKTVFVMALLKNLVEEGHRTLIFSQSRVMLNILESAIREEGWRFCRIDGSVASSAEREARVNQFQTSSSIPIFLLTSQVGGLGLTLTAADRVIILDPAWNPSTDNQSVDRAYRIGQKRDVVVYRLISCGTVEEKIYRRQVFKGGLSRTGMEEGEQFRYFAQQDLRDLFRLDLSECQSSRTQQELHALHAHQRRETPELRRHLEYLATLDCYAGVSDHDLLFSKKEKEAPPAGLAAHAHPDPSRGAGGAGWGASGGGGAGAGASRGAAGSSPRKGVFSKTANQGWSGGSELSDMFAKAVTISGGGGSGAGSSAAVAAAARPPGSGWGGGTGAGAGAGQTASPTQRRLSGSASKDPQQERVEELEETLERKRHLLSLAAGLADGGARVRSQIMELEQELAAAKAALANRGASGPASGSSSGGAASAAAAANATPAVPTSSAAPVSAAAPPASRTQPAVPARPAAAGAAPGGPAAGGGSGAGSSNVFAAAAAAPLPPSGKAPAVHALQLAQPVAPAATAAAAAAAAAQPAASGSRPAASPLLTRMRDMLWGSGKQQAPTAAGSALRAAVGYTAAGKTLSFDAAAPSGATQPPGKAAQQGPAGSGSGLGASSNGGGGSTWLKEETLKLLQDPPAPQPSAHSRQAGRQPVTAAAAQRVPPPQPSRPEGAVQGAQVAAPAAPKPPAQGAAQQEGAAAAAAAPKPPLPLKELKAKLMDTLLAIKTAESGGYFDRHQVERLRRRAERLTAQYRQQKAEATAAAAAGAVRPL